MNKAFILFHVKENVAVSDKSNNCSPFNPLNLNLSVTLDFPLELILYPMPKVRLSISYFRPIEIQVGKICQGTSLLS